MVVLLLSSRRVIVRCRLLTLLGKEEEREGEGSQSPLSWGMRKKEEAVSLVQTCKSVVAVTSMQEDRWKDTPGIEISKRCGFIIYH
ncbi:hypothetical protein H6P81_012775 [Aristolochia fimbriata]|uniref:Uncharacterized protein n=1 Tax=Aristolochia fimbriata TaxID=158543 RepID=A0AAV7ECS9_ARIFI|nr:hypothetical protein H6P81_012775 [Aristolochia fimbriata]